MPLGQAAAVKKELPEHLADAKGASCCCDPRTASELKGSVGCQPEKARQTSDHHEMNAKKSAAREAAASAAGVDGCPCE